MARAQQAERVRRIGVLMRCIARTMRKRQLLTARIRQGPAANSGWMTRRKLRDRLSLGAAAPLIVRGPWRRSLIGLQPDVILVGKFAGHRRLLQQATRDDPNRLC